MAYAIEMPDAMSVTVDLRCCMAHCARLLEWRPHAKIEKLTARRRVMCDITSCTENAARMVRTFAWIGVMNI